jgi:perosamine synthetase
MEIIMKIPLGQPIFDKEMEAAAVSALQNERFVLGESVHKFEEEFAKYCGTDHAISVSSGTDALQLSLLASGLKPNQKAITTPASFIATANAIIHVQGTPKFVDINSKNYTIDTSKIKKAISEKTKAIVPVHLYGYPAGMDGINEIAEEKNLIVIEDACQAHGATYDGKKTGNLGAIGCFSFYPSKNMTVGGDGGMITTNDEKIAASLARMRDCGRRSQYVHDMIGYTSRLNSVNAAIGRIQLKHLDEWNEKRRRIARLYDKALNGIGDLSLPPEPNNYVNPVYHCYVIRTKRRDALKTQLESQGIGVGIHYVLPIHLQPIYQELYGMKVGTYPNAEELCETCLSLPIYPTLEDKSISFVTEQIVGFYNK